MSLRDEVDGASDTVDQELVDDDTTATGGEWHLSLAESSLARQVALAAVVGAVIEEDGAASRVRLGNYVLSRRLGMGGMGEVFSANHVETGESVALKTLSRPSPKQLYRFKREFRLLADVPHPNLVRLHELEVSPARAFFTMELIDGVTFVDWVRTKTPVGQLPDVHRLEHALRQLIVGVHHLHTNGCVHRDIKPSNVLVCKDGRVVILDFGLAYEFDVLAEGVTHDHEVLGTPAFMAPEQARGERVGPAADYYAVGVMLYQCLTGRLPLEGPALQLLAKKQETLQLRDALAHAPGGLRDICFDLLSFDPDERPNGPSLLSRLATPYQPGRAGANVFIGRDEELAVLHGSLERVCARHEPAVVHIRGRSGHGKSALALRFASSQRENPRVVVLQGRCRERESLPYKGIDAIVDALGVHLRRLTSEMLEPLRPQSVDALVRVFPMLEGIWPGQDAQTLGPSEIRGASGAALREIFIGLSQQQALVVHIDDFQWADVDSANLLQALLQPPQPPSILLLLSYRSGADSAALRELDACEFLSAAAATVIEIGPLPSKQACEFASMLMRRHGPEQAQRAESIVLRAGGVPFFIAQMVLGELQPSHNADEGSDLDQIVSARLDDLSEPMRAVLDIIAVSGRPSASAMVLELCPGANPGELEQLCAMGLLVTDDEFRDGVAPSHVETAHDRIREIVVGRLERLEEARLHRSIGEWLLAHQDADARVDTFFAAVDHLNSGVLDVAALGESARASFADLNHRVGQRALESGASVAARRYFGFAMQCIEPWLPAARKGGGEYARCSAIVLGMAQAEAVCEDPHGDVIFAELLSWSLPTRDLGRFLTSYLSVLVAASRWQDCYDHAVRGLERLGIKLPKQPSRLRVMFALYRGWRTVRNLELTALLAMPEVRDDQLRAAMGIMAEVSNTIVLHPGYALLVLGHHATLTAKHGYHEYTIPALVNLINFGTTVLGDSRTAGALCDDLFRLAEQRPVPVTALANCHMTAGFFVYPRCRPLHIVALLFTDLHRSFMAIGDRRLTVWATAFAAKLHVDAGTHLGELTMLIEDMRQRAQSSDASEWVFLTDLVMQFARALIEGDETAEFAMPDWPEVIKMTSYAVTMRQIMVAVFLGQYERAWAPCRSMESDYVQVFSGWYHTAFFAMFSVIVMAEREPTAERGVERRRIRRAIRERRRTIRRWAKDCPENYRPMAELVDAEIFGLQGRFPDAMAAYERAVAGAEDNHIAWLVGLASDRLGRLARRFGHRIVAKAAFDSAQAAYDAWGATGVARRISGVGHDAGDRLR